MYTGKEFRLLFCSIVIYESIPDMAIHIESGTLIYYISPPILYKTDIRWVILTMYTLTLGQKEIV